MHHLNIVLLTVLILGVCSKYSTTPKYSFNGLSSSTGTPQYMFLSQDSDRLAIISNSTSFPYDKTQTIFNLNGGLQCSNTTNRFPAQTNLLYYSEFYRRIVKMASPCGSPITVVNFTSAVDVIGVGSTDKESFVALGYNNSIIEYNIGSGSVSQSYFLSIGETVRFITYSVDRDYLWAGVKEGSIYKIVSYETSSGSRKNDFYIFDSIVFYQGNNDGDAFISYSFTFDSFVRYDKDGSTNIIYTPDQTSEIPLGVCTSNDLLLTMKISLLSYTLSVIDTKDGSEVQSFDLGFIPGKFKATGQVIDCTDDYLVFVDIFGNFQVYDYTHPLPVWAIVLIVVGGVLIIGGAVGFYVWRKRQMQKNGGYQKFGNDQVAGEGTNNDINQNPNQYQNQYGNQYANQYGYQNPNQQPNQHVNQYGQQYPNQYNNQYPNQYNNQYPPNQYANNQQPTEQKA